MKEKIIIAISGKSGCGNTTISKMVSEKLELSFINFTFRSLAEERGIDLKKMLELAAADDEIDRAIDVRQVALARESSGCVIGSRLAVWMLEEATLKVYLEASADVRAQRIAMREGGSIEETAAFTAARDEQDRSRYLRIYDIDTNDYGFVDLVIDTDKLTPDQIVGMIIAAARVIED